MNPTDIEIKQAKIDLIRHHFADFVDRKDVTAAERNFAADFIDHNPPGGTKTIAEGWYWQGASMSGSRICVAS